MFIHYQVVSFHKKDDQSYNIKYSIYIKNYHFNDCIIYIKYEIYVFIAH